MFVKNYCSQVEQSYSFSKQQASDFAKQVAGDYNPIHDPDSKRFCVPGDLLFALTLSEFGLSQSMNFDFQGMVGSDTPVQFVEQGDCIRVENERGKSFLTVTRSGDVTKDETFVSELIKSYVAFSGKTFPHIIVKLMKQEGVMVNAEKPMVIYDQMKLTLDSFSDDKPSVELERCQFDVNGKRGLVSMFFDICAAGKVIGKGEKQIIMSGLRPFEQAGVDLLVQNYEESKAKFQG
ncbi:DUF3581 family protein [Aliikangiella sp. IMCC44632]